MISFLSTIASHYIIVLFLLANLAIGFWAHTKAKANSFEDYALASRSLPTGVLVMTLLGTFVAAWEFQHPDTPFKYGILHSLNQFFHIISFLLTGTFIAPCLVHFSESRTMGDLMRKFYGDIAQLVTGTIGILFALLMLVLQIKSIGEINAHLIGMNPSLAILSFGLFAVIYSMLGGMRAVSYTDVLQFITGLLAFSLITQVVVQKVGGVEILFKNLSEHHPKKVAFFSHPEFFYKIKSAIFWGLSGTYIFTLPISQRMLAVNEKRKVRKMWYLSAVFYGLLCILIILIGLAAFVGKEQFNLTVESSNVLMLLTNKFFTKGSSLMSFILIGFLGIILSTIDSHLHAIGISLVQDLVVPLRKLSGFNPLSSQKKIVFVRLGVAIIGCLAIAISCLNNSFLISGKLYEYTVLLAGLIITPLILGIVGIKTDKASWISFCTSYLISLGGTQWLEWHIYDSFLVAVPLGILTYFLTHIYINRGILILKRSEQTISEQLWIPTWQGMIQYVTSWIKAPLHLPTLASRKIVNNPTHSLSFSMLIFLLYTFSSVITGGNNDLGLANFMAGIHVVGITLCAGLMLEGIWPDRLKPYFALYWFFTLFYCLTFGSTLAFLRAHGDMIAMVKWIFNFMLLVTIVDSISFLTLSFLGTSLAMASWYALFGSLPADLLESIGLSGAYLLLGLLVIVVLFKSSKEQYISQRFDWNRTASSALGHDLRLAVSMLGGTGRALNNTFKVSESMTNTKGEKGYWIPEAQATFLENFSEKMIERGEMAGKEIQDFSDFIKTQVVGILEQKKSDMRVAAQDAIHKLEDKVPSTIKMKISGGKGFSPKVLSGVFKNVFYNLLWNAVTHGKASKVEITIDKAKRTVTVRDNGKGIPSDVLPRIFDLNFSTGIKRSKNSGVGLAFVKMVVLASSGNISCHSRHGDKNSFTAFVMEFPEA